MADVIREQVRYRGAPIAVTVQVPAPGDAARWMPLLRQVAHTRPGPAHHAALVALAHEMCTYITAEKPSPLVFRAADGSRRPFTIDGPMLWGMIQHDQAAVADLVRVLVAAVRRAMLLHGPPAPGLH